MNLLGAWLVDEADKVALARLGDVLLEFDEDGGLRYTIREQGKRQIINLRYRVDGSTIVTDQPSAPQVERTQFSLAEDGVLTLAFGGIACRFVRAPA